MVNNVSDGAEDSSTIFAADLVISAPATDEDKRHQPDAEPEGEDDPQRHGKPACEADLRFAEAGPQARNHDDHHQDCAGSDRHGNPIAQRSHRLFSLAVRGIMIRLPPPAAGRRQSAQSRDGASPRRGRAVALRDAPWRARRKPTSTVPRGRGPYSRERLFQTAPEPLSLPKQR